MITDSVTIRMATPDDAPVLQAIYAPYVENTAITFEYTAPTVEEFRGRIERTLREYPYLVAEMDGRIVGYTYAGAFHSRDAYRHSVETSLYVAGDAQGRGIGPMLYGALEKELLKQNVYILYACVTCTDRADDTHLTDRSIRFHKRMGYRVTGTHDLCGYKFNKWYSIIWLEKLIAPRPKHPENFIPLAILKEKC